MSDSKISKSIMESVHIVYNVHVHSCLPQTEKITREHESSICNHSVQIHASYIDSTACPVNKSFSHGDTQVTRKAVALTG